MKKIFIVIIIIEILLSIAVICLKESAIIGNYGENSNIYKIIDSERELPENANIKFVIKIDLYLEMQYIKSIIRQIR